ncbi:MAG: phosphoribosyltransferase family protein [Patescibacteria group bacterium]|nr:phosphoribosyltransferase family protein [Patescibacteria group bacterium]
MSSDSFARVADMIFAREALKFGAFRLKLHEKFPDAPLSPFYLNLRTPDNPKPGPLTPEDCILAAELLWRKILESGLTFSAIAGIPNAGDPLAEAIEKVAAAPRCFKIIRLRKKVEGDKRQIMPLVGDYRQGERVLLLDDLITRADSKFEAIEAIKQMGLEVAGLIVSVDRQQGGRQELEKAGYTLISAFTITELFDYYYKKGMITWEKYEECLAYLAGD